MKPVPGAKKWGTTALEDCHIHEVGDGEGAGVRDGDTYKGRGGSAWLEGAFIPAGNLRPL